MVRVWTLAFLHILHWLISLIPFQVLEVLSSLAKKVLYMRLIIVRILPTLNVGFLRDHMWIYIAWVSLFYDDWLDRWVHSYCWRVRGLLAIIIEIIIETRLDRRKWLCHLESIACTLYFIDLNFDWVNAIPAEVGLGVDWLIWLLCGIVNYVLIRMSLIYIPALLICLLYYLIKIFRWHWAFLI